MIINKITEGFVVQTYDTETKKWTAQEFIAGDDCVYEDETGTPLDSDDMGDPEPYLPFEMIQPE